ncbi:adenylate kinase [Paenarthrobacter aurescens]|uniref:Adenylate kinase n=1 Tax=Paenarthrobacter aurescens TaxID=43663 RepID=A0A4Y3NFM9_PAEAU|nr:adenylate kinase [Paenarthrobacter aurescens]MDO6144820.1 adenylate kinase [Paenarthrobacter aurescens]MDO6148665.1 adenylate kinase [Paenarthrobacter aurescens]MDO6159911.1 adenylate kinase [Paenarthrobacter aurescens]MDO6163770.1 adenylate kinase [Paenarthrobacter aurescens]GEB17519.1 adenylate kinase [Paenarthrobacter aurescens]
MARLIIMGPPGSGKGTQAEHIARHFGIPAISTGELFRAHVRDKTELGTEASGYMDRGEFVPDHVTTAMLRTRLEEADAASGFLLDGYPRTVIQIGALDEMLADRQQTLEVVLELTASDHELLARMLLRAKEQGRRDDTEPVIQRRLELYRDETQPVLTAYLHRGILLSLDGSGDRQSITKAAVAALEGALAG